MEAAERVNAVLRENEQLRHRNAELEVLATRLGSENEELAKELAKVEPTRF